MPWRVKPHNGLIIIDSYETINNVAVLKTLFYTERCSGNGNHLFLYDFMKFWFELKNQ